ncbi:hypothetical protein PR002_g19536 [Phytophthora rubi]|uniref:Uncharacterized protein n=1 Tax=Phytophthora rubi TaxID=129364 RepID=A0A6A3JQM2_9STRA|nr:hypothetical protein PR002_g19536 [Phytophthora rubi]
MNGYVPGSRVRVNLVIEYVADKKSGHDVVCFIKHVSALTSLVNEYSKGTSSQHLSPRLRAKETMRLSYVCSLRLPLSS